MTAPSELVNNSRLRLVEVETVLKRIRGLKLLTALEASAVVRATSESGTDRGSTAYSALTVS